MLAGFACSRRLRGARMNTVNPAIALLIGLGLSSLAGCSATKDEISKELDHLKAEVTEIRAANAALKDRLDAMDRPSSTAKVSDSDDGDDVTGDRPQLEVVHLSPDSSPEGEAEVETEPVAVPVDNRPAVDIVGDRHGVKQLPEVVAPKAKTVSPRK